MDYMPHQDAEDFRVIVRQFLEKRSPEENVRALMETSAGHDPVVWTQLAGELGLQGLALPEAVGGSGASLIELGVVFEELGRSLYPGPFFATLALAATALLECGDAETHAELLPAVVAGERTATLAWSGQNPATSTLSARSHDGRWTVSGTAPIVVDGADSDLVLVAATTAEGVSLFLADTAAEQLTRTALTSLDLTRRLARLEFDETPVRLIGEAGRAESPLTRTFDIATLLLAAEQLGGAARVLETVVDHARTRVQFGRAIGSFQAIKHRCADLLVDVESARSVVHHGIWSVTRDPEELPAAASLARSIASDVYTRVASQSIQIHGGIGFTWEHSAHLFLKRAKSSQLLLGPPSDHRARLASLVLDPEQPKAEATDDAATPLPGSDLADAALERDVRDFLLTHPVDSLDDRALREARFDSGLAVVGFRPGDGGRSSNPALQSQVESQFLSAGCPDWTARNVIGLGMALPTIHTHGTDAQRERYLRPCFSGEEIWCQLFSEPGAGSDLAALSTRAERDGDHFVVNGQKVWTSLGHVARFGLLLARTDPAAPKHKGLTYFIVDMQSPGVEVRPIRQITGEAEFNEVYLSDVRVPASQVLGGVGQGWKVAMTTLSNERVSLGSSVPPRGSGPIAQAVQAYQAARVSGHVDAATTERLMRLWTRVEAARLTNIRASAQAAGEPGPEGSLAKLQMAELNQSVYEFCVDLSGHDGLLIDSYDKGAPDFTSVHGGADVRVAYLRSIANSIEGGTSEIQRTIIGERVLGLPSEPRTDRDIPWRDTIRS